MQYLLISVPVILMVLFPKSGSGFGLPRIGHRFRGPYDPMMMMGMMDFDPEMEEMFVAENAIETNPEFQQIKSLCEEYVNGSEKMVLDDSDLELMLINECEKWQQRRPSYIPHLQHLQRRVTVNPLAAIIFNRKQ